MTPDISPAISIVITVHNEAAGIGGTLASLKAQTMDPARYEIVLIDDRSTDGTADIARAAGHPGLTIHPATPDPASRLTTRQQALDLGFRTARGAVIVTLDGDCRVAPGWLEALTAPLLAGKARAVAGPIGFAPPRGAVARWQNCDAAYYFAVSALLARLGGAGGVFFGNFAFQADLYARVGGFDRIGFALTEDLAFAQAIQAAGTRITYAAAPALAVVAPCPDVPALIARTVRIASGKFSALAAVLAVWPLLLPALLVAALTIGGAFWPALGLRYLAGVAFTAVALNRHGLARVRPFAFLYEPLVFALALAVLISKARGKGTNWGGQSYG